MRLLGETFPVWLTLPTWKQAMVFFARAMVWWTMSCFFFQAEDGIRDIGVTGVQTCALPISCARSRADRGRCGGFYPRRRGRCVAALLTRRECGALWARHWRLRTVRTNRLGPSAAGTAAHGPPRGDFARHRRCGCHARSARGRWSWLWGLPVRDGPGERRFSNRSLLLLLRGGHR